MYKAIITSLGGLLLAGCAVPLSDHPLQPANLGASISETAIVSSADEAGEVSMEKISVATWSFGVRHCDPEPAHCKVKGRDLDAEIFVYLLNHPEHGRFLIDAGFPEDHTADYGRLLGNSLKGDDGLVVTQPLGALLASKGVDDLQGVFITHLHFDHIQGVRDLPTSVPIYVGSDAGRDRHIYFRLIAPPLRAALKDREALQVLPFSASNPFVDVFGDGALIAIHVPGHTEGSTAYLVNTASGRHLITGDAVMDAESWTGPSREVQGFKENFETMWESRQRLRDLAGLFEEVTVHPGHETITRQGLAQ